MKYEPKRSVRSRWHACEPMWTQKLVESVNTLMQEAQDFQFWVIMCKSSKVEEDHQLYGKLLLVRKEKNG